MTEENTDIQTDENIIAVPEDTDQYQDLESDAIAHLKEDEDPPKDKSKEEFGDGYKDELASDPVKKRVGKLTKKWRTAEAEAQRERDEKDRERAKAEALAKRIEELEKTHTESSTQLLDDQEKDIQARLEAAEKDADVMEVSRLHKELRGVDRKRTQLELRRARVQDVSNAQDAGQRDTKTNNQRRLAPAAQDWVDNNAEWFDPSSDDYDERKAKRAGRLAARLKREYGFDDDDPDLYDEIDQRLGGRNQDNDQDERPAFQGRRGGAGGVGRGSDQGRPTRKGGLNKHDLQNMSRFGLDPKNMEHRKIYAENKSRGDQL